MPCKANYQSAWGFGHVADANGRLKLTETNRQRHFWGFSVDYMEFVSKNTGKNIDHHAGIY